MEHTALNPSEIGRGISEFGFMVMCCASYLITSTVLLFIFIKWFTRLVDNMMTRHQQMLDEILRTSRDHFELSKQVHTEIRHTKKTSNHGRYK